MTITERHQHQVDIALYNVIHQRNRNPNLRERLAYWVRQSRRLTDAQLLRVAATLPK